MEGCINMLKVEMIPLAYRRVVCQDDHCSQYAQFAIYLPTKSVKLCSHHIADLAIKLCEYGFVRRAVQPVITEKGL